MRTIGMRVVTAILAGSLLVSVAGAGRGISESTKRRPRCSGIGWHSRTIQDRQPRRALAFMP